VLYLSTLACYYRQAMNLMVPGFGRFTLAHKAARTGRNPQTGEAINIAAKAVPVFRPAKQLKEKVLKLKPKKKVSKSH
jgi:integration host factor subunit beta